MSTEPKPKGMNYSWFPIQYEDYKVQGTEELLEAAESGVLEVELPGFNRALNDRGYVITGMKIINARTVWDGLPLFKVTTEKI